MYICIFFNKIIIIWFFLGDSDGDLDISGDDDEPALSGDEDGKIFHFHALIPYSRVIKGNQVLSVFRYPLKIELITVVD